MSYTVPYFRDLVNTYPTFEALKGHCEANHLTILSDTEPYCIIRYDKSKYLIPIQSESKGFFRSVVWDTVANRVVCVAPPKAQEELPEDVSGYRCEEFLEGVMVNAFLDASGTVQLATRSKLGATGTFYSNRSFQSLFEDALRVKGIDGIQGLKESLGSTTFASFLLQHPEHRIVSRITAPNVYLIHTGSVDADGLVHIQEVLDSPLAVPTISLSEQPQAAIIHLAEQRGWQWQGVVLKDGQGSRYRLRSKAYTMVRTLRGESPRKDIQYLKLREKGMMETYLYYYPEDKQLMWDFETNLRGLTQLLYQYYVSVHIKHQMKFVDVPPQWKTHVFMLHSLYLGTLKEKGHFIRKQEVIQYMNNLQIPRVLHLFKSQLQTAA
jgi:hypothetical protein